MCIVVRSLTQRDVSQTWVASITWTYWQHVHVSWERHYSWPAFNLAVDLDCYVALKEELTNLYRVCWASEYFKECKPFSRGFWHDRSMPDPVLRDFDICSWSCSGLHEFLSLPFVLGWALIHYVCRTFVPVRFEENSYHLTIRKTYAGWFVKFDVVSWPVRAVYWWGFSWLLSLLASSLWCLQMLVLI